MEKHRTDGREAGNAVPLQTVARIRSFSFENGLRFEPKSIREYVVWSYGWGWSKNDPAEVTTSNLLQLVVFPQYFVILLLHNW